MEEALQQPTRRRIYETVSDHPGSSARDVQRILGLAWGETAYHLDQLTRAGALRRERGGRRDFYFRPDMTWDDRRLLQALRSPTERRILLTLVEAPGLALAEIQERVGISPSTCSLHLRHLMILAVVESVREGNTRRYRPTHPLRLAELVRRYQGSFGDRLVDRFVEMWGSLMR